MILQQIKKGEDKKLELKEIPPSSDIIAFANTSAEKTAE